jgi:hypothetical protein
MCLGLDDFSEERPQSTFRCGGEVVGARRSPSWLADRFGHPARC